MTGSDETPVINGSYRAVLRTMHAADDRRLAVVVLFSAGLIQLFPAATAPVLAGVLLLLWNSLERHASIFNSSFILQRQQTARMRIDFVAGLLVVSAYLFGIARTLGLLVGDDPDSWKAVLFFCSLGAGMTWIVFNQGWQFSKALVAFAVAMSTVVAALGMNQSALVYESALALWAENLARIGLLAIAIHSITWRTTRGVRYAETFGLPIDLARTISIAVLLTIAVERPGSMLNRPNAERWIWILAVAILLVTVAVELFRARADLRKEYRALIQVMQGVSVPPRRHRLGIWTQLAFVPASVTIGMAPWLEWSYCLFAGLIASLLAAPRSRRQTTSNRASHELLLPTQDQSSQPVA